jgi:hypothetical protein
LHLFITNKAADEQKGASVMIFSGEAKGEGCYALFRPTYKYVPEPEIGEIVTKIGGKSSSFSVPGILDVTIESP